MRKTFVAALVAAFMVVGLVAYAGHTFRDVPSDHTFHNDIQWGFDNGLTFGCNPASGGDLMCPDDPVTRGQMMAFFNRYHNKLAGDVDIDRIVNEVVNEITLEGTNICEVFGFASPCANELAEFLRGPKGDTGAPGTDGDDGLDGQDGTDGIDGTDGVSGYELIKSPTMQFADTGFAGWSCPAGKVVLGGGTDIPAQVSAPAGPGSVWPHYTFGADEYGWVVQKAATGAGAEGHVYVICATVGE